MITTDVVVIDSGINTKFMKCSNRKINGISIFRQGLSYCFNNDIDDTYGHGTAVVNIITKHSKADVFVIKIFENGDLIDEEALILSLEYVRDNITCKAINLSMGLKISENKDKLKKICSDINDKGIIIISAFDNDACISYPAAFDNVIGVGSSYKCKNAFQFEYIEGSPINILAKGGFQRILWNNDYVVMGGSSFACAYITAYILNLIMCDRMSYDQVLKEMKEHAVYVYKKMVYKKTNNNFFDIRKAALFPINKEMHSLIRNVNKLKFEIKGIYDIKQSGRVGANVHNIIDALDNEINITINDIESLDYNTIDTLVIGHMSEINRMMNSDVRLTLIKTAIENNVNVFSFDSLQYCAEEIHNRKSLIYSPIITQADVPQNTFGKLYNIDKPVLAVLGTSSKQGKFTLQLILKDLLNQKNYKVGMIGTEPHSLLFGADYVYPMGYNSTIFIDGHSSIILLNKMINDICEKGAEIIITGSQANTIPTNNYNVVSFPIKQHVFLMGIQPDAVILCVNPQDDIRYIINTIKYIEGVTNCQVIGLVLFPMILSNDWKGMFQLKTKINEEQVETVKERLKSKIGIPIYVLGQHADMQNLTDSIIEYFSCGENEDEA